MASIPRGLVTGRATEMRLGDVANRLERAFDAASYGERSYHAVPNGFALVSRLEQIRMDGTPKEEPNRWSVDIGRPQIVSLSDYFKALFTAPKGRYRVIVFVVTDQPVTQKVERISKDDALEWLHSGGSKLPKAIAIRVYSDDYETLALIYEFERTGERGVILRDPSDFLGRTHLEKAEIWKALSG